MTSNWFDPSLPAEIKAKAQMIIDEIGLGNAFLRIRYNPKQAQISFTLDRRVVDIPLVLLERQAWGDIRFLFRAILQSAPSQWNLAADQNDWSAFQARVYKS